MRHLNVAMHDKAIVSDARLSAPRPHFFRAHEDNETPAGPQHMVDHMANHIGAAADWRIFGPY